MNFPCFCYFKFHECRNDMAIELCIVWTLQVISYMRGLLLFIFNFHPENSYERYIVGAEEGGEYQVSSVQLSL